MAKKKKNLLSKQPIITAIDLGTSKITVIIASFNREGNFEIKGIGETESRGIENGMVKDIRLASDALKKSIDKAESQSDTKAENIFVSITGKYIKSTNANSRLPITDQMKTESGIITQEHVDKVVKTAVEIVLTQEGDKNQKLIHSIPQSYKVDDQPNTHNPVEMSGDILTAHIHVVLADINCIKNIRRCFEIINYKIEQIVFAPLAAAKAVLTEDEKNLGCVLIDIGGGTTDIVFFFEKIIILSAVRPKGGNEISSDISRILQTSGDAAEKLKTSYGDCMIPMEGSEDADKKIEVEGIGGRNSTYKSKSLLCEIIHSRVLELLEECYKSISSDNYHKYIDAGIVLTGGSASLTNIDALTSEIFNMPVRKGKPNIRNLTGQITKLTDSKYATVVGLLYYAKDYIETPEMQQDDNESNIGENVKGFFKKVYEGVSDFFQ